MIDGDSVRVSDRGGWLPLAATRRPAAVEWSRRTRRSSGVRVPGSGESCAGLGENRPFSLEPWRNGS